MVAAGGSRPWKPSRLAVLLSSKRRFPELFINLMEANTIVSYLFSTHFKTVHDSLWFRYVGEMITSEEAEERGKKYDAEGRFENLK